MSVTQDVRRTMSSLIVVAKVIAKKEYTEAVRNELFKLILPTRKEKGCKEYNLHQDNDNPSVFVFYETWDSLKCLEAHMKTEHFKNYVVAVQSMIEIKIVHKMSRVV